MSGRDRFMRYIYPLEGEQVINGHQVEHTEAHPRMQALKDIMVNKIEGALYGRAANYDEVMLQETFRKPSWNYEDASMYEKLVSEMLSDEMASGRHNFTRGDCEDVSRHGGYLLNMIDKEVFAKHGGGGFKQHEPYYYLRTSALFRRDEDGQRQFPRRHAVVISGRTGNISDFQDESNPYQKAMFPQSFEQFIQNGRPIVAHPPEGVRHQTQWGHAYGKREISIQDLQTARKGYQVRAYPDHGRTFSHRHMTAPGVPDDQYPFHQQNGARNHHGANGQSAGSLQSHSSGGNVSQTQTQYFEVAKGHFTPQEMQKLNQVMNVVVAQNRPLVDQLTGNGNNRVTITKGDYTGAGGGVVQIGPGEFDKIGRMYVNFPNWLRQAAQGPRSSLDGEAPEEGQEGIAFLEKLGLSGDDLAVAGDAAGFMRDMGININPPGTASSEVASPEIAAIQHSAPMV
ncbi:MAG: hypothetical protein ACLFP8_01590 [Alphaproteobacteria bacterium]